MSVLPLYVHLLICPHRNTPCAPQDKLWQGLREVLEGLQAGATAVWHLQRVVAKKKDPLSHVCFLDVLIKPDESLLTERFW